MGVEIIKGEAAVLTEGEFGVSHCNQWGLHCILVWKCVNRSSCRLEWLVGSAQALMYYMGPRGLRGITDFGVVCPIDPMVLVA